MNLRDYWLIARKNWLTIVSLVLVALTAGFTVTSLTTPLYASTTRVFVSTQQADNTSDLLTGSNFTQQRVKSYADIVTSPSVLDPVIEALGLPIATADLEKRITATVPLNTVIIEITVLDESPVQASSIANAISDSLTQTIYALEQPADGESPSPVRVSIVQPGTVAESPDSPRPLLNLALSLLIGLVSGFGIALLRESLDLRLKSNDDVIDTTKSVILGGVAYDEKAEQHPLIVHTSPRSVQAEAYRQLRTNVKFVEATGNKNSLVITSSIPNEGKTTTACNLAIALADTGKKVLLIDGDFRKPDVAKYMGVIGAVGLSDVLIGQAKLSDVLQPWGENKLTVLPAGSIPPNPSELLGSDLMINLLAKLEKDFDTVIIDAAPLLPVTDAAILSHITGGVILVVGMNKTTRPQLEGSVNNLETGNAKLLGTVLNKIPMKGAAAKAYNYGYGYGYGYGEAPYGEETSKKSKKKKKK